MTKTNTLVALTTATIVLPTERHPSGPDATHLVGAGLFVLKPQESGWDFSLRATATDQTRGEALLLEHLTGLLPETGTLIGWRIVEDLLPPLIGAAESVESDTGLSFLDSLHRLVTAPVDDLAIGAGGAAAPSLAQHLQARGLAEQPSGPRVVQEAWLDRRPARLFAALKEQALALVHLWSMAEGDAAAFGERADLRVALGRWLAERRAEGKLV